MWMCVNVFSLYFASSHKYQFRINKAILPALVNKLNIKDTMNNISDTETHNILQFLNIDKDLKGKIQQEHGNKIYRINFYSQ